MPLRLEGELSFTVDGPRGATTGTAHADGTVLHVRTEDPLAAWDAVAGAVPSAAVGLRTLADRLAADGLSVELTGPAGVLATIGSGADSALGRAVTGSRHVQPGRTGALRPLVLSWVGRAAGRRGPLLLAVAAVAVLAVRGRSAWR
jgi:hypothetical protein